MALLSIVYNHYQQITRIDTFYACHVERFIYNSLMNEVGHYIPCMPYSQEELIPVQTLARIREEIARIRAIPESCFKTKKRKVAYVQAHVTAYQEFLDLYATGNKPAWYVAGENWQKVLVSS